MKKKIKIKNKNSNRVNIINTIKFGNNKKRSNKRKVTKSGVSSIIVNVPIPQPYYIPITTNSPFHIQPSIQNIPNPTKLLNDEMKREIISANDEYIKSKPTFIEPKSYTPIKKDYESNTEYFSTNSSSKIKPKTSFFTDDIDSDSEIQQIPIKLNAPTRTSINKMKQSQIHSLAEQMGISIDDPETHKKRSMKTLKNIILSNKGI